MLIRLTGSVAEASEQPVDLVVEGGKFTEWLAEANERGHGTTSFFDYLF